MPTTSPANRPVLISAAKLQAGPINFRMSSQTYSTGTPTTMPAISFHSPHADRGASLLMLTAGALSAALAIFLAIAGILILMDRPIAGRLHWIYVIVKFPLVALSAYATWWLYSSIFNSTAPTGPLATTMQHAFRTMTAIAIVVLCIIALIYPVALLIVLSTRTAKNYFSQLQ